MFNRYRSRRSVRFQSYTTRRPPPNRYWRNKTYQVYPGWEPNVQIKFISIRRSVVVQALVAGRIVLERSAGQLGPHRQRSWQWRKLARLILGRLNYIHRVGPHLPPREIPLKRSWVRRAILHGYIPKKKIHRERHKLTHRYRVSFILNRYRSSPGWRAISKELKSWFRKLRRGSQLTLAQIKFDQRRPHNGQRPNKPRRV